VLADSVVAHPEPALMSGALGLVYQTILREDDADDGPAARRVYAASEPLLTLASRPEWKDRLEPGAGRVKLAMGTIETRAGNLAAAKPLLESSVALEPTVDAHLTLAAIERQASRPQAALEQLTRALATPEAKQHPRSAGEAHLNAFEVLKDLKASDKANVALASALTSSLEARRRAKDTVAKVHAERLLARVLFRFSDTAGATRATERAFVYAGQDKRELAATVLEAAQRAFLKKDVAAARTAVTRGLGGELADDDIVYAALWLLFTEKEAKTRSDGTAARALASIKDDGRWPGRLSSWALGKLKDGDLLSAARTMGQKTEASFYTSLSRKVAGDAAADKTLAEVAKSTAIDLVEVRLARDLLAGPSRFADAPMPAGVSIP
jgi:tetratricopeptide (TPR) repeat protein